MKKIGNDRSVFPQQEKHVNFLGRVFYIEAYNAIKKKHNRDPVELINSLKETSEEIAEETKNGCFALMGAYERTVLKINPEKCTQCGKGMLEGRIFVKTKDGIETVCSESCEKGIKD